MPRAPRVAEHPELGLPQTRKLWQTEGLFSDHYLKTRIPRNSWWPKDGETEPVWRFCKELYEKRYIACARNEAQTLGWGILTSGNEWRLYARDAKPSHFFALDFSAAIESLENFKYFVGLFSPAAFVRDPQGRCRLDDVRETALAAQVELEEN